ncbi:MAG: ubiquinone/menaquinone biosynthesis methyltransferase [Myxococcales bacterium]
MTARPGAEGGHAVAVQGMFDRISPTYDLLNRLLSFGIDRSWRKRALSALEEGLPHGPVLDSCAGTMDLAAAVGERLGAGRVVAADFSREMLVAGRQKVGPETRVTVADAMNLPFGQGSFAGMTCAFGMRNLADPERGIAEALRVLRPGGRFVVLEFFRPTRLTTRAFHAFYGRGLLPLVGRLVSGDGEAYGYLSDSMRGFLTRGEFSQAMGRAGFRDVGSADLTLGIASLIWGRK